MNLGLGEIAVVLLIAFVVVGPKDLPKIARAIAKAVRQLKGLYRSVRDSLDLEEELAEVKKLAKPVASADPLTGETADIRREIQRLTSEKVS